MADPTYNYQLNTPSYTPTGNSMSPTSYALPSSQITSSNLPYGLSSAYGKVSGTTNGYTNSTNMASSNLPSGVPKIDSALTKDNQFYTQKDVLGLTGQTWQGINNVANLGLGALSIWNAMENNKIAKDTFNFNKEMKTKEYDMAKSDWDKRVARSEGLAAQLGSGYGSANSSQLQKV